MAQDASQEQAAVPTVEICLDCGGERCLELGDPTPPTMWRAHAATFHLHKRLPTHPLCAFSGVPTTPRQDLKPLVLCVPDETHPALRVLQATDGQDL